MIQKLREKLSGVIALGLIILIAVPLAFFGISSIFFNSKRVTKVAQVNGETISDPELSRQVAIQQSQLKQLLGDNFDPSIFDSAKMRSQALQSLINKTVIYTAAKSSKMGVSQQFVGSQVASIPQFQVGGKFSEVTFRNYLGSMGYTVSTFMQTMAHDLVTNQLMQGIQASSLVTQKELENAVALARETRSYEYLRLSVDSQMQKVSVSDDEIKAYYQSHQSEFALPERVSVDYVELDADKLAQQIKIDPKEVQDQLNTAIAAQPTQRRVSHILLPTDDNTAKKVAEIKSKLANGESFADLAKEYSIDVGSASKGGDLGFTSGDTFPPAFEQALAKMKVGEVSAPVVTDAGTHILKLTDIAQPKVDKEAERQKIIKQIRSSKAEDEFQRIYDKMQEQAFSTDTLEQLKKALADDIDLQIQSTQPFSRDNGQGIASNAQVRAVAFGDDVLQKKLNSEIVTLEQGQSAVVVHLHQHWPKEIQPLDQAHDKIVDDLTRQKAADQLASKASSLLKEVKQGGNLEDIARREDAKWQVSLAQTRDNLDEVGSKVFAMPITSGLPAIQGFSLDSGDYVIAKLKEVEPGKLDSLTTAQQGSARESLRRSDASMAWSAYLASLKNQADIKIDVDLSNSDTGAESTD